ncbi:RNA-binding protein [Streptococcus sp. CSL10205-OR2]|uniref:YlmH family RNA-binding protein n=1 Tax=Streptococcus sp. CSL10205-OR2 TaxID=2980558 RepID=UPI0021DB5351|nr:YlmH/Sll1252 family protein [Streptococcus sp. CSL10205-OR2]MCU9534414.1 YlmH/Sll1252 family protein [Streptococcus sp. CSL10205-OR2]
MTEKNSLYQHFRPDEKLFLEKIEEFIRKVEDSYFIQVTDFLDPRQVYVAKILLTTRGITYYVSSDYYEMEYAKIIISPPSPFYEMDFSDFGISLLNINYNDKFNQLTHAQILGTLIHTLGIKRTVIGDIIVKKGQAQLLIDSKMVSYFKNNIHKIGRSSVSLTEDSLENLLEADEFNESVDILTSSLRADNIIASVLKVSRTVAMKLISAEKVKINYMVINKTSEMISVNDIISVRGYGRFIIASDNGLSKQKKHKLTIIRKVHK